MTAQPSRRLSEDIDAALNRLWILRAGYLVSEVETAIRELEAGLSASALAILGRARARADEWRRTPDQESPQ